MKILVYTTQIQEKHLDSFGHVNNAIYMELYEEARWSFIESVGYTHESVEQTKKGPIILEAHLKYKSELVLGDKILIKSRFIENKKNKITRVHQVIEKQDGTLSNEAEYVVGFMDLEQRKLISFPETWVNEFF